MTVPDTFRDQEDYDEWLADLAETEMENYLHDVGDDELTVDSVHAYVYETPALDGGNDMQWARLMFDVREYAHVDITEETVVIPHNDPFATAAICTESAVREDLACRVHELLESEGYEVVA